MIEIDVAKLKYDMALLGEHLKKLKKQIRAVATPTWEDHAMLRQNKDAVTALYVLRASLKNKHHVQNKSCKWHNDIIQNLAPGYRA